MRAVGQWYLSAAAVQTNDSLTADFSSLMPIIPLRTGWEPGPEDDAFYPDDLPQEWRLTFFSNEFWAVLAPSCRWRDLDPAAMQVWVADTTERFRFFLELPEDLSPGLAEPLAAALGSRFGGLIGHAPSDGDASAEGPRPVCYPSDEGRNGSVPLPGLAWVVPECLTGDARAARNWLELRGSDLATGQVLALLGACPIEDLRRWQRLVELLGLS